MINQHLCNILCHLPEKGGQSTENLVQKNETETDEDKKKQKQMWMTVQKQKKY